MLKYLVIVFNLLTVSAGFASEKVKFPGEVIMGKETAPIVIQGYSSLTCGHCAVFHETVLPKLKAYIDRGEVKYIFRHFPSDKRAVEATALVISLPEIRQPTAIHALFSQQSAWVFAKEPASIFAQATGLDVERCKKIIADKKFLDQALKARLLAEKQLHIDATPFFVINGRIINYALSWEELEKYLKPSKA